MADLIENCKRHRVMIGLLTVLGALLLGVRAQKQEIGLEGNDVTLVPNNTRELKEITWTLNDILLVEIILKPQEEFIYNLTNDRTTINKTNGALTIKYLNRGDSGLYRAQVILMNNSIQVTEIRLTVRDCPDQPTISVQSTKDWFVVSCKSFSTDVTYEWFNSTRSVSKSRLYTEPKKSGTLTCVVDNGVCNKNSSINFYIPDQTEEKSVGDNVTLVPQYTGDPSEIIWMVNGYKLVEMVLKPQVDRIFYRLQDGATISETDGRLTIRDLTMGDSGNYTAVVLVNNEYYYTEIRLTALKSGGLSAGENAGIVIGVLAGIIIIIAFFLLWYCCCRNKNRHEEDFDIKLIAVEDSNNEREEESERCITVKFGKEVISQTDESHRLLEDHSKSPRLTIHGVQAVDDGIFTAEAVMSDKKEETFTDDEETSVKIDMWAGRKKLYKPNTMIHVKELVWKKDGVTQFKWAVSSLKFLTSNIKLKRESVTVYDAEGKKSYKVYFRLEGHPESMSIRCITFHPIKITDIDPSTWKKDGQPVNIGGDRIKSKPNGDLTIYDATSKDKGKYTVQCIDNELDQEFILHL